MARTAAATDPIRVLIVDDQLPFRDAAHALIDASAGFEWIGGASSGEEGVEQAERLRPDLVLMDVRMTLGRPRMFAAGAKVIQAGGSRPPESRTASPISG